MLCAVYVYFKAFNNSVVKIFIWNRWNYHHEMIYLYITLRCFILELLSIFFNALYLTKLWTNFNFILYVFLFRLTLIFFSVRKLHFFKKIICMLIFVNSRSAIDRIALGRIDLIIGLRDDGQFLYIQIPV